MLQHATAPAAHSRFQMGFGLLETIVALGLFLIFAGVGVTVVLHSFALNRLGENESEATLLAQEGIEAARSMQRQNWTNMATGTYGISASGGTWAWSGNSDTTTPFTRQVVVAAVQRDGSDTIVTSGGTVDSDTVKVTSTVTWNMSPTRTNSVTLSTYLTNWQKAIGKGGLLVYADYSGDDDVRKFKTFSSSYVWSAEQTIPDDGVPLDRDTRRLNLYSSKTRNEKILISKHSEDGTGNDTYMYAQVWNGSSWGNTVALANWAGITNADLRTYDGTYLNNGNFMLVYSDNTTVPKYIIWNGTSWSVQANVPDVGGVVNQVILKNRPNTNELMLATFDAGQDTNTVYWNGSSWGTVTEHAANSTGTTFDNVDFAWSPNTPTTGALIFNNANDNTPNIRIWNGTAWGTSIQNMALSALSVTRGMGLAAQPNGNQFLGCFKTNQNTLECLNSSFTPAWVKPTNYVLTSVTTATSMKSFGMAYEQQTGTTGLVVYSGGLLGTDRSFPKWKSYNATTNSFSFENSMSSLGLFGELESAILVAKPSSDDIMTILASSDQKIWTVLWNGTTNAFNTSGDTGLTQHASNGSFDQDYWFDFAWDQQ